MLPNRPWGQKHVKELTLSKHHPPNKQLVSVQSLMSEIMEKREQYEAVIKKKRKALFEATKQSQDEKDQVSAKQSVEAFFQFEKLFGKYGEQLRDQMLQQLICKNP